MLLVEVGSDDDFKAVAPHFLCQFYANLVGKLWRDLIRLEALIPVPSNIAVGLSVALLGQNHLPQSGFPQAVEGGDILALLRSLRALHIGKHIVQVLQLRRFGLRLFGVLHIVDEVFQAAFDVPKRSRSHRGGRGRVISHLDGHSIVRSTHCPPTNQLENYFRFERRFFVNFLLMNMERQKEPVHSTSNQREKISRYIFDETMYRL